MTIGPLVNICFENLPCMSHKQPIKLSDLDNSYEIWRTTKEKKNIPSDTTEIANFHFFYYNFYGNKLP